VAVDEARVSRGGGRGKGGTAGSRWCGSPPPSWSSPYDTGSLTSSPQRGGDLVPHRADRLLGEEYQRRRLRAYGDQRLMAAALRVG